MNLKGNSGCNIERQDGVVVKSAVGSYVPRLREQAHKQMAASNIFGCTKSIILGTPITDIVEDTTSNNEPRIQVTMPYIKGPTVAQELLGHKGISAAKDLSSFIGRNFAFNNILNSYDIFKNKCDDMIKKTPSLKEELEWFLSAFQSDLQTLRAGYCHGDLTLENIIVGKWKASEDDYGPATRALYLIDFLDSFIDTPYVDVATVLQDCLCHWSYRYDTLDYYQNEYLKEFTRNFLENFYYEGYIKREFLKTTFIFLLFKIYRIVPYAKDNVTKEWCDKNIKYVKNTIDIINGMEFPHVGNFIREMDLLPKRNEDVSYG